MHNATNAAGHAAPLVDFVPTAQPPSSSTRTAMLFSSSMGPPPVIRDPPSGMPLVEALASTTTGQFGSFVWVQPVTG